jgi:hypothetical protein
VSKLYRTYLFKDKDPVIDIARTCVQIFATTNNISFSRALTLLEKASGVSRKTMENWFGGPTVSPRFCCVAAVVRATGEEIKIGKTQVGRLRHLTAVA